MKTPSHLEISSGPRRISKSSARPFVFVNMAMTADGKIATANRAVSSFGSRGDQEHMLELRATADAVMMGARTVESDGITMGPGPPRFRRMRLQHGLAEYNLRIIVSGSGSISAEADVFRHRFSPIIILTTGKAGTRRLAALRRVAKAVAVFGEQEIDFNAAMKWLRREWGVRRLLSEGGGELNAALFRAGMVDQLHLTICPAIFGGRAAPTIADGAELARLAEATALNLQGMRRVRDELFTVCATTKRAVTERATKDIRAGTPP